VSINIFSIASIARPGPRERTLIGFYCVLIGAFLPIMVRNTVVLGHGDVQVFFRAAWAVWTGYPLYQVVDHHGWTYHYPPTFALLLAPFADPLPGAPQPWWTMPYPLAVAIWYVINVGCLLLGIHVWSNALERYEDGKAREGTYQGSYLLRFGSLLALLPFAGDGLARGQPAPLLFLLIVLFLVLYIDRRLALAAFMLALAVTIKLFPLLLAAIPLLRRDWKFLIAAALWALLLLIGLPSVCIGPHATFDLYQVMWADHVAGIVSGAMNTKVAHEVTPGAFSSIGVGAMVARIAAGGAFDGALPRWASLAQFAFNIAVVVAVVLCGRGGFWNLRGPQPAAGYPVLVAGAVMFAAVPLMIPFAGPQYATYAIPLMGVFLIEAWRHIGRRVLTVVMIGWSAAAWLSMLALELPWDFVKTAGPMTIVFLLLVPAALGFVAATSGSGLRPPLYARGVPSPPSRA
jgi:hypothetical protein